MWTTDRVRVALMATLLIAGCGAPAVGGPLPSPRITCTGVPQAKCDEAVASALRSLPNTAITAIEIVCVADRCSDEAGAMDTVVRTADGGTLRSSTNGWSAPAGGGEPPPGAAPGREEAREEPAPAPNEAAIPRKPQCQGVPVAMCELMAETAFGELSTEGVQHILVRCGALEPCTADRGVGETLVTYADGTIKSAAWEYDTG